MKRIFLSPPHMGSDERELLIEAFDSNWIAPVGPQLELFEAELAQATGTAHCATLVSGTAGLHLALIVLGVKAGDEVVVPTLTFAATANSVCYQGARPVFIDCDRETWTLDAGLLADLLADRAIRGRLPKAVITVDLYGQCCDYGSILPICSQYGLPVIQDAAEALGATYEGSPAGSQGDLGVLSFNGNKIITTSGGGALVSNRREWIDRARYLATQARDPFPHYEHSAIGYNYRLSNLLAAVGRGQLKHLADRVAARRALFERYEAHLGRLPGWSFMPEAVYGTASRWLTCATINPQAYGSTREDIRAVLETENIESRPVWKPMHMQPVFSGAEHVKGEVAANLYEQGICLPSGSSLTDAEFKRVIGAIHRLYN